MTKQTSISVLIAILVAAIAAQAMFVSLDSSFRDFSVSADPHAGALSGEAESFEAEEKQDSPDDSGKHFNRHSSSKKFSAYSQTPGDWGTTAHKRRSELSALRTRAP